MLKNINFYMGNTELQRALGKYQKNMALLEIVIQQFNSLTSDKRIPFPYPAGVFHTQPSFTPFSDLKNLP